MGCGGWGVGVGGWGVGGAHYQCAYMLSTSSTVKIEVKNVSKCPNNFCAATNQMVVKSVFKCPINPINVCKAHFWFKV